MTNEAKLAGSPGLVPEGAGWFVVNMKEARWKQNERFGTWCAFEGDARFPQLGINVHMLKSGQAACMYHSENSQEDFLVLSGHCTLIVNGEERSLSQWDFVHCPAGTTHVFVGAGEEGCAILMIGARSEPEEVCYPVEEVAQRHGAGVDVETASPAEAYADAPASVEIESPWPPSALEQTR